MSARLVARSVTVQPDAAVSPILEDAGLELRSGEVHALVGPNGAGKSTLFGVLSGDIVPASGSVELDGRPVGAIPAKDLARQRAVLLQQNDVAFAFTVEQVVRMGRAPWARTPREDADDDLVDAALAATDMSALRHRAVRSLSGGERARVALARVLAQDVGILLLDEPTAALDLRHQEDVLRIARERADAGATVALVLHDLNAALAYGDRATLLSRGRVVATGTPAEVVTAERIGEVYGQAVDILTHPVTGIGVVVPRR
ncbi:heme ABC transporter ATP-binding protein [Microbacterium sp. bgisy207]|uniref:heme ABC transporter ATP-binding protein n=1 Tax=Microbacterium sp. bgisy207 TaxID=3413800 RepID=UPI003EBE6B72